MNSVVNSLLWIMGGCFLGFILSALFSNHFKLSRRVFLIPYIISTTIFLIGFFFLNKTEMAVIFTHNWLWGIILGIAIGAFLVKSVFSQPASRKSTGWEFVFDLIWVGLAYGIIDGLFLNVMPVLAVIDAVQSPGWLGSFAGKIAIGIIAIAASLLITLVYHLGYSEFRNKSVGLVLIGNALITLSFILSGNPLGAILSHTAMHVAAVIRGPETTIQLPPHR